MSFLEAVRAIGQRERQGLSDDSFSDIDSFTQMVVKLGESEDETPQEIHVILDVLDPKAECLKVRGIKEIVLVDYWAGEGNDREKRLRYLYRDPVSPRANWRYSPLYKLGQCKLDKGVVDAQQALLGKGGDWRGDSNSRFYKLYNSTLFNFEKCGVLSEGSVALIMDSLVANVDRLAELWSDKKRSYIILFGLADGDRFLYPIETPAFLKYFRDRLAETNTLTSKSNVKRSKKTVPVKCGICHNDAENPVNLDKVFTFATLDKESFLPGMEKSNSSKAKIFPICQDCYRFLSEGRNVIDEKFLDDKSIPGFKIYTIPELTGETDCIDSEEVEEMTTAFLQQGLHNEEFLGPYVLKQGNGLVYHFLFWEPNNKQMRILLMIEDVPPSRLNELETLWKETASAWRPFGRQNRSATLWQAINIIRLVMLGGEYNEEDTDADTRKKRILRLNGKNKADVNVLRDRLLKLLGCLLRGEKVDVMWIKELIVSRLPGICANPEWSQESIEFSVRFWNIVVDFLYRTRETSGVKKEKKTKGVNDVRFDFFDDFQDPYMKREESRKGAQGVFLAGVVFGMIARGQAGKNGAIDSSPLYKQIHFGRIQRRDLSQMMARVPDFTRPYEDRFRGAFGEEYYLKTIEKIESLYGEAGKRLLEGLSDELGVDGNFAFSIAFFNAPDYFRQVFKKQEKDDAEEDPSNASKAVPEPVNRQFTLDMQ